MRQSSKRILSAILILDLSGCTAQEWERALAGSGQVTEPSQAVESQEMAEAQRICEEQAADPLTSIMCKILFDSRCNELNERMRQAYNAAQNDKNIDNLLELKRFTVLYKAECEELNRMWCIAADRLFFQKYGYSMEESILRNPDLATNKDVLHNLRACRRLTGK